MFMRLIPVYESLDYYKHYKYEVSHQYVLMCEYISKHNKKEGFLQDGSIVVVVALLFYVRGKHLRSCRDGQLT